MNIVFLNGEFLPIEEAKISPLDRGFLFGDGIYEVIPAYNGNMVGFRFHIDRLKQGLADIEINLPWLHADWSDICLQLLQQSHEPNLAIYMQVSRGADSTRGHAYPNNLTPTVFVMTMPLHNPQVTDKNKVSPFALISTQDLRWQHCDIKSTSLLGNVLHFQQAADAGCNETLLFNGQNEITEASSSNVFIVKNNRISTPKTDKQILPGITRKILIGIIRQHSTIQLEEEVVSMEAVLDADELWITSSTKGVVPVITLDGKPVGNGKIGPLWEKAALLYHKHMFDV